MHAIGKVMLLMIVVYAALLLCRYIFSGNEFYDLVYSKATVTNLITVLICIFIFSGALLLLPQRRKGEGKKGAGRSKLDSIARR